MKKKQLSKLSEFITDLVKRDLKKSKLPKQEKNVAYEYFVGNALKLVQACHDVFVDNLKGDESVIKSMNLVIGKKSKNGAQIHESINRNVEDIIASVFGKLVEEGEEDHLVRSMKLGSSKDGWIDTNEDDISNVITAVFDFDNVLKDKKQSLDALKECLEESQKYMVEYHHLSCCNIDRLQILTLQNIGVYHGLPSYQQQNMFNYYKTK